MSTNLGQLKNGVRKTTGFYYTKVEMSRALLTGYFSDVFAKRENLPKIYEIRRFSNFAGNAPKLSKITGKLPENLDWGGPV